MEHNTAFPAPEEVNPHRDPHKWLDGILEAIAGVSAHGFWIPGFEHFKGHFGLLMGHKQSEALAQLGLYALLLSLPRRLDLMPLLITSAETLTYPVRHGDILDLRVEITPSPNNRSFTGHGIARVGENITCEADISGRLMTKGAFERLFGFKID